MFWPAPKASAALRVLCSGRDKGNAGIAAATKLTSGPGEVDSTAVAGNIERSGNYGKNIGSHITKTFKSMQNIRGC